jgi:hypothetical protein
MNIFFPIKLVFFPPEKKLNLLENMQYLNSSIFVYKQLKKTKSEFCLFFDPNIYKNVKKIIAVINIKTETEINYENGGSYSFLFYEFPISFKNEEYCILFTFDNKQKQD